MVINKMFFAGAFYFYENSNKPNFDNSNFYNFKLSFDKLFFLVLCSILTLLNTDESVFNFLKT